MTNLSLINAKLLTPIFLVNVCSKQVKTPFIQEKKTEPKKDSHDLYSRDIWYLSYSALLYGDKNKKPLSLKNHDAYNAS